MYRAYIYIIDTPNLGSSASVLGSGREHGRFNQAHEGAARRSKGSSKKARRSIEEARKNNEKAQKKTQKLVLAPAYNCLIVCYVRFSQDCCLNFILKSLTRLKQHRFLYLLR